MQSDGLRLNALSLELAAIASVLGAFDAAALSALAVAAPVALSPASVAGGAVPLASVAWLGLGGL